MWRGQPRHCKLLGWKVPAFIFLLTLLVLSSLAFHLGRKKALNLASGHRKSLHSLPEHYGFYLALYLSVPASIVFFGWYLGEAAILEWLLKTNLPENALPKDPAQLSLFSITYVMTATLRCRRGRDYQPCPLRSSITNR